MKKWILTVKEMHTVEVLVAAETAEDAEETYLDGEEFDHPKTVDVDVQEVVKIEEAGQ